MQIQPLQPVSVKLKCGHAEASCLLVELTDTEMQLTSKDYLQKDSPVVFLRNFLRVKQRLLILTSPIIFLLIL